MLFLGLLLVTSLAPSRLSVGALLHDLLMPFLIPVSEPLERLVSSMRPPDHSSDAATDRERELEITLSEYEARIYELEDRVLTLMQELEEFQAGYASDTSHLFTLLRARRAMESRDPNSRVFRINAGHKQGVVAGVIAITAGHQLVGRVTSTELLTATITPITQASPDDDAPGIDVVILPAGASIESGFKGNLRATGKGSLAGLFDQSFPITVGDPVRLNDVTWGSSHTGLLVGQVEAIKPYDPEPAFVQIVVRPSLDVDRVSAVMLRLPRDVGGGG